MSYSGPATERRDWGEGAEKIFGGHRQFFFLKFGSKDQKKGLHPKLCLLSGYNPCLRGRVHSQARRNGMLWCRSRLVPVRSEDLKLDLKKTLGEDQTKEKNVFGAKS